MLMSLVRTSYFCWLEIIIVHVEEAAAGLRLESHYSMFPLITSQQLVRKRTETLLCNNTLQIDIQ